MVNGYIRLSVWSVIIAAHSLGAVRPLLVAHRGASGYEPENTLRAFARALAMGAGAIELDVYQCASGELVVIHDKTLDRTTNGHGLVQHIPWSELVTYDAGKGEKIPLLEEVLDMVGRRAIINIEVKDPRAVQPLAAMIQRYVRDKGWKFTDFLVSSFDHAALTAFHKVAPEVPRGALFDDVAADYVAQAGQIGAEYIIVPANRVTRKLVTRAHRHGHKLYVYTVNHRARARHLTHQGVDGIITNYPDLY